MTKYMLKVDIKHPTFKQIVLASKGIGDGYFDRLDYLWQKQNYKNKIFTEKEREKNVDKQLK